MWKCTVRNVNNFAMSRLHLFLKNLVRSSMSFLTKLVPWLLIRWSLSCVRSAPRSMATNAWLTMRLSKTTKAKILTLVKLHSSKIDILRISSLTKMVRIPQPKLISKSNLKTNWLPSILILRKPWSMSSWNVSRFVTKFKLMRVKYTKDPHLMRLHSLKWLSRMAMSSNTAQINNMKSIEKFIK